MSFNCLDEASALEEPPVTFLRFLPVFLLLLLLCLFISSFSRSYLVFPVMILIAACRRQTVLDVYQHTGYSANSRLLWNVLFLSCSFSFVGKKNKTNGINARRRKRRLLSCYPTTEISCGCVSCDQKKVSSYLPLSPFCPTGCWSWFGTRILSLFYIGSTVILFSFLSLSLSLNVCLWVRVY